MYSPVFYKEDRVQLVEALIRDFPFAVLITKGGEQISHLPLIFSDSGEVPALLVGHMARANPHWRELQEKGHFLAIFQGPHGYISPAWYAPKKDSVPTWNYVVVHVSGRFEIVEEKKQVFELMDKMVGRFESFYQTGWQLSKDEPAIEALMKGIVVFKLTELVYDAKFKLSQKINQADRENVVRQLNASGDQVLIALASQMSAKNS